MQNMGRKTRYFPFSTCPKRSSLEDTITELARSRAKMEESRAQIAKASLEKTMVEVRRSQADFAMVQVEN